MPMCERQDAHLLGLGVNQELERRLAARWGMQYAVLMPSATTGLMALGLALELRNKTFVTTPLTYGATAGAWLAIGARGHLADVDADTLTLRPDAVWGARQHRPAAVLAVSLFGMPVQDERLRRIADALGAWYVVDAAQAFGASLNGAPTGQLADAVVLSFTAGKTLDAGEGGAVLTNRRDIYERLIWVSQHPYRQKRELGLHRVNEFAINGRLHPNVARLVLAKLGKVDARLARHRRRVRTLLRGLAGCAQFDVPGIPGGADPSWLRVTARVRHGAIKGATQWVDDRLPSWSVDPLPVTPLYLQAGERDALYGDAAVCPVAEREWQARVCFTPAGVSFSPSRDSRLTQGAVA